MQLPPTIPASVPSLSSCSKIRYPTSHETESAIARCRVSAQPPGLRPGLCRPGRRRAQRPTLLTLRRSRLSDERLLRRHPRPHRAVRRRRRRRHATDAARCLPLRPRRAGDLEQRSAGEAEPPVRLLHDHRSLGCDGGDHRHHCRCTQHRRDRAGQESSTKPSPPVGKRRRRRRSN